MKLCCCYTGSHRELFEQYFKPSLPGDFEVEVFRLGLQTRGDFGGPGYYDCLREKIRLVAASLAGGSDEIVVWSDVDIIFLRADAAKDLRQQLEKTGCDALFQKEGRHVEQINGGFYVCRANARTAAFFREVLAMLEVRDGMLDQDAINHLLGAVPAMRWGFLPFTYYARTHGWPPPRDIVLYHANETLGEDGVRQKIRQFEEVRWIRRYGWPATAWSCLPRIRKRLRRLVAEHRAAWAS